MIELVLEQDEHRDCEAILAMAASGLIELVVPMVALIEPSEALRRRLARMVRFSSRLEMQLKELTRIGFASASGSEHNRLVREFRDVLNPWKPRLAQVRRRVLDVARVVPVDRVVLERAEKLVFDGVVGKEPDALVAASVLHDLEAVPSSPRGSLFLNRNARDFDDCKHRLKTLGCDLIGRFAAGRARLGHLKLPPPV